MPAPHRRRLLAGLVSGFLVAKPAAPASAALAKARRFAALEKRLLQTSSSQREYYSQARAALQAAGAQRASPRQGTRQQAPAASGHTLDAMLARQEQSATRGGMTTVEAREAAFLKSKRGRALLSRKRAAPTPDGPASAQRWGSPALTPRKQPARRRPSVVDAGASLPNASGTDSGTAAKLAFAEHYATDPKADPAWIDRAKALRRQLQEEKAQRGAFRARAHAAPPSSGPLAGLAGRSLDSTLRIKEAMCHGVEKAGAAGADSAAVAAWVADRASQDMLDTTARALHSSLPIGGAYFPALAAAVRRLRDPANASITCGLLRGALTPARALSMDPLSTKRWRAEYPRLFRKQAAKEDRRTNSAREAAASPSRAVAPDVPRPAVAAPGDHTRGGAVREPDGGGRIQGTAHSSSPPTPAPAPAAQRQRGGPCTPAECRVAEGGAGGTGGLPARAQDAAASSPAPDTPRGGDGVAGCSVVGQQPAERGGDDGKEPTLSLDEAMCAADRALEDCGVPPLSALTLRSAVLVRLMDAKSPTETGVRQLVRRLWDWQRQS